MWLLFVCAFSEKGVILLYNYKAEQALMNAKINSTDKNSDGLYYWSLEDTTVETVATARIFTGFFNLGALSSGMPRKLYFNNVDTSDYGVSVINVTGRWEIPEGEETTMAVPTMDGAYYHHTKLSERTLEMKCLLKQDTISAIASADRQLNQLFNPKKGECKICFDDEYFYWYQGRFREKAVNEMGSKYEIFSLTFACSKPYIYGETQYYRTVNMSTLENRGSLPTPLKLTILGYASFPVIKVGDSKIYVNTVLNSLSDKFIVDSEKYEIILNGAPAAHLAEGAFLFLEPGTTDISISDGVLEIEFNEMWL